MDEAVTLEINEKGVALVTMNQPQCLNAFNHELCKALIKAIQNAEENEAVKVIVLTGSGPAFSAGGDIGLLAAMSSPAYAKWAFDGSAITVQTVYDAKKPVIAAVNGAVAGAALAMMMAADLIIAAEDAKMFFSFIHIAFCPDSGCSYFLVRKLGYQKAAEILWFGKILSASQGVEMGLINKAVPSAQLLPEAMKWAERLAGGPLYTARLVKQLLRQAAKNSFYEQAEAESLCQVLAWSSRDFKEGSQAFLEKRKPVFTGS